MKIKDQLRLQAMYAAGAFTVGELKANADASRVPQSPDDIDDLRKGEVREWLEVHGVENPPAKVADMKDMLKRVMFVSE